MSFICKICEYITEDKSNYNKHLISKKHFENIEKLKTQNSIKNKEKNYMFICHNCNRGFRSKAGLTNHHNKCIINNIHHISLVFPVS